MESVDSESVASWFDCNLQLSYDVTEERALQVITESRKRFSKFHMNCLVEFRIWNGEDARGGPQSTEGVRISTRWPWLELKN